MLPILKQLSKVERRPVDWLWPGRIASGRITLIAGDPGLGKSWLTLDIASRVSIGTDWPDGAACPQGSVVLMNCEDDLGDTIAPRLELLGANLDQVVAFTGLEDDTREIPLTLEHHEQIRTVMEITRCRLLIIDPIAGFLPEGSNSNSSESIRSAFRPIASAAEATGCAVVIVAHLNKSSEQSALYRLSGSVQFSGASRTAYYVGRDRSDHARRLMMCVKNNIGLDRWALAYRVEPDHSDHPIQWEPDEITSSDLEDIVTGAKESEEAREVAEWLKARLLKDGHRGTPVGLLQKEVKGAGWSWNNATKARYLVGAHPEQINGEWYWTHAQADPTLGRGWKDEQ